MTWKGRPARRRARDGFGLYSSSERRGIRKRGGNSARQQRKAIKSRRAYKKGKRGWANQKFW